jgi:ammonium transporter Rh
MAGTIFLYLYWPSFNAALAPAINQQRIVVNTALSMSASCIGACSTARLIHGKLDMEIVLNATLAGGVIIGACVDMIVDPFASIIVGGGAGIISAIGFAYLTGALKKTIGLHDTCGVHNLHGIPGILGGIISAITAATAVNTFKN